MQFYSKINFHCILNEAETGAVSDSVQAEMGQQNLRMAVDDQLQAIYYADPNGMENIEEHEGQPNIRLRRPSRSQ